MLSELEQRLRDTVTLHEELFAEWFALGERLLRVRDKGLFAEWLASGERLLRVRDQLERIADDLYAEEQDAYVAVLRKGTL